MPTHAYTHVHIPMPSPIYIPTPTHLASGQMHGSRAAPPGPRILVRPGLYQLPCHLPMAPKRSPMQRGVPFFPGLACANVGMRAPAQEHADHLSRCVFFPPSGFVHYRNE